MKAKHGFVALSMLVLCASSANAAALSKGQWLVGADAGLIFPVGDFQHAGKVGFGGSVDADYVLSPGGALGVTFTYNRSSYSDDLKAALSYLAGVPVDGHFSVIHYGAHAKIFLSPETKTRPYFTVGGGLYSFKATFEAQGVSGSDSETKPGINGGAGLLFDAGTSAHVGVQGTYHDIFTTNSSTQYVNAGIVVLFDLGKK